MKPTNKPTTSADLDEMFRTGKTIDAAVARAVRKAVAAARPRKTSARTARPRSKRGA